MVVQIVFVHGVGGAKPASQWLTPLNHRLAGLGYSTITEPTDSIFVPDYESVLNAAPGLKAPETYEYPPEKDYFDQRLAFAVRQQELERSVTLHSERSDIFGYDDWPRPLILTAAEFLAFPSVKRFVESSSARQAVWASVLSQMPKTGPVIVVAHSLGSVVAAGLLRRLPPKVTVDLLITIGSPLTFARYRKPLSPLSSASGFPYSCVRAWLNVYSPWDPVSGSGLADHIPQVVDVCAHLGGTHDLEAYMSHPAVAEAIGAAAFPRASDAASDPVPSRRMHDSWRPLLLGTAFTWQLANAKPNEQWRTKARLDTARSESAKRVIADIKEKRQRRAQAIARAIDLGANLTPEELLDHPLADGRHPIYRDLTVGAAPLLQGTWSDEQLLSLAVGLMIQPLVPPFDIEADSQRRVMGLELTLNVVRAKRGNLADKTFASQIDQSTKWARDRLSEDDFSWGTLLFGAGLVLLAATGAGLLVAAPAGLAGAAVVTSTLAAFGPGGMVGGLLTLGMLTGTASGLGTLGVAMELEGDSSPSAAAQAAATSGAELAFSELGTLIATLIGMLAVIHAQPKLGFESTEPLVRSVLNSVLDTARAEHRMHSEVAPGTEGTKVWAKKVKKLERAVEGLGKLGDSLPRVNDMNRASQAIESGDPPKDLPPVPALQPGSST